MKLWLRAADVILIWNPWGVSVTLSVAVSLKSSTTEEDISAMEGKKIVLEWQLICSRQKILLLGKENVFYETRINPQMSKLFQLYGECLVLKDIVNNSYL